jgi:ribosomal protein S18 acetylase RimI-like enzyme
VTASSPPGRVSASLGLIEWGRERARAVPWRSDARTALLVCLPDARSPSPGFIRRCLDRLAGQGYTTVITGALAPHEQQPFLAAGFGEHERLHLLGHDLTELADRPHRPALRRGRRADRDPALAVDAVAFDPFWRLDCAGLQDAINATPATRFRVASRARPAPEATSRARNARLCAYAISGRSERHGYLQRLAVDPAHQRSGLGRALALDALHWMRRHGVDRAVVNTQLDNHAALELYHGLGFRLEPVGLAVLRHELHQ